MHLEDIDYRPVTINKMTYDVLLKEKERAGLLSLYNFYCYTAIWQKTNQPKCTVDYAAKGLNISTTRIRKYRKKLIALGLIEDVITKNKKGIVIGHFVKVQYYNSTTQINHPPRYPEGGLLQRVDNVESNAYRTNSKNAYRTNNYRDDLKNRRVLVELEDDFYNSTAKHFNLFVQKRKLFKAKIRTSTWTKILIELHIKDNYTKAQIKQTIDWYKKHHKEKYTPKIYKVKDLQEKFPQIIEAKKRDEESKTPAIVISKTAQTIFNTLTKNNRSWPKGSQKKLAETIQISLTNYECFFKQHKRLLKDYKTKTTAVGKQVYRFAAKYLKYQFHTPNDFIVWWFDMIWEQICNWKSWSGNLSSYVFDIDVQLLSNLGEGWAMEWCSDVQCWHRYVKAVKRYEKRR